MLRLIGEPVPWVHPTEREPGGEAKENATIFHILAMTEGQSRKLRAVALTKNEVTVSQLNRLMQEMFMACVVKIENIQLPGDSAPRTIEDLAGKERFLDCVPAEYMQPIYQAIQNLSDLDEGARKNSGASHVSQP